MKKLVKNITLLFLLGLGVINRFLPKFNIIIFFTNNKESNDNNRALLKTIVELGYASKYKIYFFSRDGEKYNHFDEVHYKKTALAPFYYLFSRYCFYDCGTLKIKPSKNQKVISLWHGVPLKKIGLMIGEQSSRFDSYNDFTKILVPSEAWVEIYIKSFDCSMNQIYINGFPRNDFLFHPEYKKLAKLKISREFKKSILWMPTFRSSIDGRYTDAVSSKVWDLPIFNSIDALNIFNTELNSLDIQLVVKIHPYSTLNLDTPNTFSNIVFVRNSDLNKHGVVNYEFVACFDGLVTDYSSILFDYLLIDKPMAFTIDDFQGYSSERGFTVSNPDKYLVGDKISNSNDFLKYIKSVSEEKDEYFHKRNAIKKEVHKFADDQSSNRLLLEVGLL